MSNLSLNSAATTASVYDKPDPTISTSSIISSVSHVKQLANSTMSVQSSGNYKHGSRNFITTDFEHKNTSTPSRLKSQIPRLYKSISNLKNNHKHASSNTLNNTVPQPTVKLGLGALKQASSLKNLPNAQFSQINNVANSNGIVKNSTCETHVLRQPSLSHQNVIATQPKKMETLTDKRGISDQISDQIQGQSGPSISSSHPTTAKTTTVIKGANSMSDISLIKPLPSRGRTGMKQIARGTIKTSATMAREVSKTTSILINNGASTGVLPTKNKSNIKTQNSSSNLHIRSRSHSKTREYNLVNSSKSISTLSMGLGIGGGPILGKKHQTHINFNKGNTITKSHITVSTSHLPQSQLPSPHRLVSSQNSSNINLSYPISPETAIKHFENQLTSFEKTEIFNYKEIYFLGLESKKRTQLENPSGAPSTANNYNYDDDQAGYILVQNDHVAYRYEILKIIGKGSFGQVIKAFDHKLKGGPFFVDFVYPQDDTGYMNQRALVMIGNHS